MALNLNQDVRSTLRRVEPTEENLIRVSTILYASFTTDPVISYMVNSAHPKHRSYLRKELWFQALVTASAKNGAEFYEVGDWKGVSIWIPPGQRIDNTWTLIPSGIVTLFWYMGLTGLYRMFRQFEAPVVRSKAKHIASLPHWYCFFVAILPEYRGQHLSQYLMEPHSPTMGHLSETHGKVKGKDGGACPVWLEATTEKSMNIYKKWGWVVVDKILLGEGTVDEAGASVKGGKGAGVPIWCMKIDA